MAGYNTKRDIELSKQQYFRHFERYRDIRIGIIFSVSGSIYVPYTNNSKVWVHEWGSPHSQSQAIVGNSIVTEGMPVKMAKHPNDPFQWQIVDAYTDAADITKLTTQLDKYKISTHGTSHQVPSETAVGADAVWVWQPAVRMFKTTGNGINLSVTTEPLIYFQSSAFSQFPGGVADLTSSVPSAGLQRWVLVYMNSSGALATVDGSTATDSPSIIPSYPSLPTGGLASAFVRLSGGQTSISTSQHIQDARQVIGGGQGGAGGATTFIGLSDTPSSYSGQSLKYVRVNSGATALEFTNPSFLELSDTPSSFSGQSLKLVRVNTGETALEFTTAGAGDVVGPSSATDEAIARFDTTTGKLLQNSLWTIDNAGSLWPGPGLIQAPGILGFSEAGSILSPGSTVTVDFSSANLYKITISQDITVTIDMTGGAPSTDGGRVVLLVVQSGGPWNITWATAGTSIEWPGGTVPDVTQTSGAHDVFMFWTWDDGVTVYGKAWGADMQ